MTLVCNLDMTMNVFDPYRKCSVLI